MESHALKSGAMGDAPETFVERGSQAPEVVVSYQHVGADGLQATSRPDNEGLHTIDARAYYASSPPYAPDPDYPTTDVKTPIGQWTSEYSTQPLRSKRRKWTLGVSIAVILVLIAVAVGVGVGVTQNDRSTSATMSSPENNLSPTASASTTSSSTSSSTSSAVTSGATGLAQFSCSSGATVASSEGVNYSQDCFTQYQKGGDDYHDDEETVKNIGGTRTVYTFKACIDACDEYNIDRTTGDPPCKAVTYYANLTVPVSMYGGSCFLKSGRGVAYNRDPFDYVCPDSSDKCFKAMADFSQTHTASAYWSCLDRTTCAK